MAAPDLVNLSGLMEDAKCFAFVRQQRWPEGVHCPGCGNPAVVRDGCDDTQPARQRYRCKACASRFDDLTGLDAALRHLPPGDRYAMVLAGHHQPLRVWVPCFYFMGLNLSNLQIAKELGLCGSDVQTMTGQLRCGLVAKSPEVTLEGEVEIDEVYVVAGHKGQPDEVAKRGGLGAATGWQARRDAARWRRTSRPSSD
jgi:predicted RNA-binding Zn-ribbon protein involved in translation (DUF1610 family)